MRRRAAALGAALLLAACGGGSEAAGILDDAEDGLGNARSGRFSLSLEGTAEADGERTEPVGFRVAGPFDFGRDTTFPVLELTYERLRGDDSTESTFVSDGTSGWLVSDGEVTELDEAQLGVLRLGDGEIGAVPSLDLAAWFEDAEVDGDVVTGEVDAAELLGDLQRIAAEVDGRTAGDALDGDAADRLRKLVTSSSIELRTAGDDHELRSLRAVVDFGTAVPGEVDDALAAYAAPRLVVELTYEPLDGPLEVAPPD